jgi:hypothetical protein
MKDERTAGVSAMLAMAMNAGCAPPSGGGHDASTGSVDAPVAEGDAGHGGGDAAGGGGAGGDAVDSGTPGSPCIELGCSILLTLTGEAAGDFFGWVSADLGDIDGDGARDFAVGAPFNAAGGRSAGRAYVYSGRTGAQLFVGTGESRSLLGFSVSSAGDVDGDGVNDFIVGGT